MRLKAHAGMKPLALLLVASLLYLVILPCLGLQGFQSILSYGTVERLTEIPLAIVREGAKYLGKPVVQETRWIAVRNTYNDIFGEGNWIVLIHPFIYDTYDEFKTNLDKIEELAMPFIIYEHGGSAVNTQDWLYDNSNGLTLNNIQILEIKNSYTMFQDGIVYFEFGEADISDYDDEIINGAFENDIKIYVSGRSVDFRELYVSSETADLFNGSYSNLVIPLWQTNSPIEGLGGKGRLSVARGQVLGWWFTGTVDQYGINFQDWYWHSIGDIIEPYEGTQDIPEWAIHNCLWSAWLSGAKVFWFESYAMMHKHDGTISPCGHKLRTWFQELRDSGLTQSTKQEVLNNIEIAVMAPSKYRFKDWDSMLESEYNDLRRYLFRTPDYEDGSRDLVTSYHIPIFYTDEYDEDLMSNFSLIICPDSNVNKPNLLGSVLEGLTRHSDVVVFRPHYWIDLTSTEAEQILGINYTFVDEEVSWWNTTHILKFSSPFSGTCHADYDDKIYTLKQANVATNNTDTVLLNENTNKALIVHYTNAYGKEVYTVLEYYLAYHDWGDDSGPSILRGDEPTLKTCFEQFFTRLYAIYEGSDKAFMFKRSNGGIHIIYPYEGLRTTQKLDENKILSTNSNIHEVTLEDCPEGVNVEEPSNLAYSNGTVVVHYDAGRMYAEALPLEVTPLKGVVKVDSPTNFNELIGSLALRSNGTYCIYNFTWKLPIPHLGRIQGMVTGVDTDGFADGSLTLSISAIIGTNTIIEIYCGNKGKPREVLVDGVGQSINYDETSSILTISATCLGLNRVEVYWNSSTG